VYIIGSMALLPVHPGWEGFTVVVELGVVARRRGHLCFGAAGALERDSTMISCYYFSVDDLGFHNFFFFCQKWLSIFSLHVIAFRDYAEQIKGSVRHVTGNDQDYLRKIPRVVVQKSALL
jgi:hypothetical protein